MARDELVSATLATLIDALAEGTSVDRLMHALTSACVEATDADAAGALLSDDTATLRVAAASTGEARAVLLAEIQHGAGPAVQSFRTGDTVSADLEGRGYASVVAVPMHVAAQRVGALALFRTRRDLLPLVDVAISRAFANLATIGLLQRRTIYQLQGALNSRVVIEQAKGIVAAWSGVDVDEAFDHLRRYVRDHNLRLDDVAHDIVVGHLRPDDL